MRAIRLELERIYGSATPRRSATDVESELREEHIAWYRNLPAELRLIAEYLGHEEVLPHERVRSLYGPLELIEANSDEGTFGRLRSLIDEYEFDRVVMIGDDAYLDVGGQLGPPGGIVTTIAYELHDATPVAPDVLTLLRQAGSYAQSARSAPVSPQPATPRASGESAPVPPRPAGQTEGEVLHMAVRLSPEVARAFRENAGRALRPDETRLLQGWERERESVDPSSAQGQQIRLALARYVTCELMPALLRTIPREELASRLAALHIEPTTSLTNIFNTHLRDDAAVPFGIADPYGAFASAMGGLSHPEQRARYAQLVRSTEGEILRGQLRQLGTQLGRLVATGRSVHVPEPVLAPLWRARH